MSGLDHGPYQSPLSWRYGSPQMRALWGELHKRRLWRRLWVALAEVQAEVGLVQPAQVEDLRAHVHEVDLARAHQIEAEIRHDLMAEVRAYAEQCPVGGGIVHLGATSMDIQDNADALRLMEGLDILVAKLERLLLAFAARVEQHAHDATMGFTHLQPAEPTTVGYRLAQYAQDLWMDWEELRRARARVLGKGFKGAVGTAASYQQLLEGTGWDGARFEAAILGRLGLKVALVATQVCPRKQEFVILSALASLGQSLYKFAFDLRILQSPVIGEWSEPFGAKQVGSSAMPFKRNPIDAENVDSLARWLAALPRVAWDNAAHTLLERTLDDSANRRSLLPEAFLLADELLQKGTALIEGLRVEPRASQRLMADYGPFAATERVLMEAVRRGGDRQALHELIREHSLAAWAALREGRPNPLVESLCAEPALLARASAQELGAWMDAGAYVGEAPARSLRLAAQIRRALEEAREVVP